MADDTAWDMEVPGDRERNTLLGPAGSMTSPENPAGSCHWWSSRVFLGASLLLVAGLLFTMIQPSAGYEQTLTASSSSPGEVQADEPDPGVPVFLVRTNASEAADPMEDPTGIQALRKTHWDHELMLVTMVSGASRVFDDVTSSLSGAWSTAEHVSANLVLQGIHGKALAMHGLAREHLRNILFAPGAREVTLETVEIQDHWSGPGPFDSWLLAGGSREP